MILQSFHVRSLFGRFDHNIYFNDENITILIAPNGYGKTICLRILHAIFNKKISYLRSLEFSNITLIADNDSISINKQFLESKDLILSRGGVVDKDYISEDHDYNNKKIALSRLSSYIPFLTRIGTKEWEDTRTGILYNFDDVIDNFGEYLPDRYINRAFPAWFLEFTDSLNVHLVQDQRLLQKNTIHHAREFNKAFTDTIDMYASELASMIVNSGIEASEVSQQLDSTFPVRLLKDSYEIPLLSESHIIRGMNELHRTRSKLSAFNLLPPYYDFPSLQHGEINYEERKVLTLYIHDARRKLKSYSKLYGKIELFTRILNTRRLSFKTVKVNAERGFYFESDLGHSLNSLELSSGEQHQVVLLYELIFKTNEDVLVLIDEPEISLHIAWQKEFLNDLKEIISLQSMPVIIATHSPQIINGNWDLAVNLGGVE
ncbi:AAA family ATPase [Cobetia amphilecti]|uniref:AAA family ATPase n=1 Tax=Cobetia amphilecti TaxID=1055104 RepID=UPI001C0A5325|nr:AAA family ATPase [Cobetia amphilecti]MBU3008360.1 AAA family ATPase [Cobetia amphilecti]